jgi:stage VI sporulation protein D
MRKNGLGSFQFDLNETIHLSYQQTPIEEFEEMELIPQIEIIEHGNEVEISGSLFLQGTYTGDRAPDQLTNQQQIPDSYEESVQFEPFKKNRGAFPPLSTSGTLENRIPVRITLPRSKVRDTEDVFAFIDSFDYEVKTPYQIEVKATLVISGLVEEEEQMATNRNDQQEQFEFVHVANRQHEDNTAGEVEAEHTENASVGENKDDGEWVAQAEVGQEAERPEDEESIQETPPDNVVALPSATPQGDELEGELEEYEQNILPSDDDVKVAITGKGTLADREPIQSLSTVFAGRKKPVVEQKEAARDEAEIEGEADEKSESIYLTNFMEDASERFTQIKMCILQKEETIDDIAERYGLRAEDILEANQVARGQLGGGQILYIPIKG